MTITCTKMVKIGRVVFELYRRTIKQKKQKTNRQTDRQADRLITILRAPPEGEVITHFNEFRGAKS